MKMVNLSHSEALCWVLGVLILFVSCHPNRKGQVISMVPLPDTLIKQDTTSMLTPAREDKKIRVYYQDISLNGYTIGSSSRHIPARWGIPDSSRAFYNADLNTQICYMYFKGNKFTFFGDKFHKFVLYNDLVRLDSFPAIRVGNIFNDNIAATFRDIDQINGNYYIIVASKHEDILQDIKLALEMSGDTIRSISLATYDL